MIRWIQDWIAYFKAGPDDPCPNPFYNPFVPNVARVLVWSKRYKDPSGFLPDIELMLFSPYRLRWRFVEE